MTDHSAYQVVERFAKLVCPTRCGGTAVLITNPERVWICGLCHKDAVSEEFVTLRAADFDRLRAENERLRKALREDACVGIVAVWQAGFDSERRHQAETAIARIMAVLDRSGANDEQREQAS